MEQALRFIEEHLGERLTVATMAAALGISPHHFAHVFKRAVGIAPHQYVMLRRLQRAKALLLGTQLPVAQIALAVGCASQSHFSSLFLREYGLTPLELRRRRFSIYAPQSRS